MSRLYWIDTTTDEEAVTVHQRYWGSRVRHEGEVTVGYVDGPTEPDGTFWYEALQKVKDSPDQRLAIARRFIPLPAAWRECAVALRARIRAAKKNGDDFEADLRQLHHLAAIQSFAFAHDRDGAQYDFLELVPFARIAKLPHNPEQLGWNELPLLKVTDKKWMAELWGEPKQHTTMKTLYRDQARREERRVKELQENLREQNINQSIREALGPERGQKLGERRAAREHGTGAEAAPTKHQTQSKKPFWKRFFG